MVNLFPFALHSQRCVVCGEPIGTDFHSLPDQQFAHAACCPVCEVRS